MRHEGRDLSRAQRGGELLDAGAAVREGQALLTPVKLGDHLSGVGHRADPVHHELGTGAHGIGPAGLYHLASGPRLAGQPVEQLTRVAHRRAQPHTLKRAVLQRIDPVQHRQQVPAAIVAGERVDLVHHDRSGTAEQARGIHSPA